MNLASASILLGALVISLSGCATTPTVRLPPDLAAISVVPTASASVGVLQPSLRFVDGQLALEGWVYKKVGVETTERTHLDVVFLDAAGRTLRTDQVAFMPRKLRRAPRPPAGRGRYLLPLPALPPGTIRIEVRADDTIHALGVN